MTIDKKEALVQIETMPEWLKARHRAANNWGIYPFNGAVREWVTIEQAAKAIAGDPDRYTHLVPLIDPLDLTAGDDTIADMPESSERGLP